MPDPSRFRWESGVQRFRNMETGYFVSTSDVAPFLRSQGGAFRDSFGRFVPNSVLGGDVVRQSPLGAANVVQIVRGLQRPPNEYTVRKEDALNATVTYRYQGGEEKTVNVSMRKGEQHTHISADEFFASGIARAEHGTSDAPIDYWGDVSISDVNWNVRTFYGPDQPLGGDAFFFD